MGILDEHKQMRKITLNRTRLSNVVDNLALVPRKTDGFKSEKRVSPHSFLNIYLFRLFFIRFKHSVEHNDCLQGIIRKRRKLQLDLRYDEDDQQIELTDVVHGDRLPNYLRQKEPDWTTMEVRVNSVPFSKIFDQILGRRGSRVCWPA